MTQTDHDHAQSGVPEFAQAFASWAASHEHDLKPLIASPIDFEKEVENSRQLRQLLWDAGWGRYGWPKELGGLGGGSILRATLYQELYRLGWCGPGIFEHVEIIAPTLAAHAEPEFLDRVLQPFLSGTESWAQGFSEPEAGSDLASLRTRASVESDTLVINGSKIWTSWAKWGRWCMALVRTGTTEERHRGLTMIAIDLESPGVRISPIRQANGTDELAEVFFDDVRVPRNQVIGEIGKGWRVAMYLLSRERGTLSWMRHAGFRERLIKESPSFTPADDRAVGDFVIQWAGLRAVAAELVRRDSEGEDLGPEAAYNKLLMTRGEQELYNLVSDVAGTRIAVPLEDEDEILQRDYLFSRIVTVYGGSQQMQLITVAKHVLGVDHV